MAILQDKIHELRVVAHKKGVDDPRIIGVFVLAFIGLSVVWNGARVVQQNYALLQKIVVLQEENRILELENRNKQIQNEYYKTPEYAELKARRVNGRAASGEQVYIVTHDTALEGLKTPETEPIATIARSEKPLYQQNFEDWIDFFFGKK
ncbi:MAG TPA: hypothetical protein PKD20_00890 [Candidatus Saccharibacteria bacterium]|jgi:cell division protein FtsB|nr:hypothetical protein [Candidatus Saccharibacteria bacterium]HMT55412.1 hypothetical protein [Candidatus Saccharibacteria bacterium]